MKTNKTSKMKFMTLAATLFAILVLVSPFTLAQGGGMQGQSGGSTKGAVIKGKAPVNKNILKVKLPRAQEASLANGLRVVLLESHKVPTFTMQMVVLSGGLSDKPDFRGVASFTATLLREGTVKRTSKDIAEQVDALGATLTSNSGFSNMTSTVSTSGLVENLDQTFDIFSDVVRNASFPEGEVEKYKTRILAQLQLQRGIPQFLAGEQFSRAIYGDHPASLIAPPLESIKKLTSKDLIEFHSTYYRPNNAILAVVGDVTLKEIMPKIEKAFGDWQKADVPATKIPAAPAPGPARIV
ncbi:MAG: M16 family metallopeptidase, partial [Pyrinomonadaceae bacterium]